MKIDNYKLDVQMAIQGLTSVELSKVTGVSQVSIARFRRGVQQPRPATLGKIARALNVPVTDIIETATAIAKESE